MSLLKKGNTELLNEINYAIDQMNAVEGDWKTTLYNKNYESIETKNLEYTEKEKKYYFTVFQGQPASCSVRSDPLSIFL